MFLTHSVHPLPLSAEGGGGGWTSNQILEKGGGGLTGPQLLEWVAGKERGDFFQGEGLLFSHKKNKIWNF